jgi:hypothetical protein
MWQDANFFSSIGVIQQESTQVRVRTYTHPHPPLTMNYAYTVSSIYTHCIHISLPFLGTCAPHMGAQIDAHTKQFVLVLGLLSFVVCYVLHICFMFYVLCYRYMLYVISPI